MNILLFCFLPSSFAKLHWSSDLAGETEYQVAMALINTESRLTITSLIFVENVYIIARHTPKWGAIPGSNPLKERQYCPNSITLWVTGFVRFECVFGGAVHSKVKTVGGRLVWLPSPTVEYLTVCQTERPNCHDMEERHQTININSLHTVLQTPSVDFNSTIPYPRS